MLNQFSISDFIGKAKAKKQQWETKAEKLKKRTRRKAMDKVFGVGKQQMAFYDKWGIKY